MKVGRGCIDGRNSDAGLWVNDDPSPEMLV